MRKIIVSNFATLDGFMAGPNGELDWFGAGPEFFEYTKALLGQVDTILFGRVTYEGMASYWPNAADADPYMAGRMNGLTKIVFSNTLDTVKWQNARLVKGDIGAAVAELKRGSGGDMVIYGSGCVVSALTKHGLIDEYHVVVSPVVLGKGKPFFAGIDDPVKLKLLSSETYPNGTLLLKYAPEIA